MGSSLGGHLGFKGKSAYDIAVEMGFNGSIEEWVRTTDYKFRLQLLEEADEHIKGQINGLASGNPLAASSTAGMTDTTKIYVNTTDGHWYYYHNSTWNDGGTYQSTEVANGSIGVSKINGDLRRNMYEETELENEWELGGYSSGSPTTNNKRIRSTNTISTYISDDIYIKADSSYKFLVVYYNSPFTFNSNYFDHNSEWVSGSELKLEKGYFVRLIAAYTSNEDVSDVDDLAENIIVTKIKSLVKKKVDARGSYKDLDINLTQKTRWVWDDNTGKATIAETNSTNFKTGELDVQPGEIYKMTITQGSASTVRCMLFCDSEYNINKVFPGGNSSPNDWKTLENFEFIIPDGCTKLCLTPAINESHEFKISKYEVAELVTTDELVQNNFRGKNIAIIGASNETHGNSGEYPNAVEMKIESSDVGVELSAYLTYYDVQAGLSLGGHTFTSSEIGTEVTFTPVAADVGKVIGLSNTYYSNDMPVWWYKAAKKLGFNPIPVAWSGSSMSSHESSNNNLKTSHAWHDAQIRKCGIRTAGTMNRTAPDLIIIARGLNDYGHSPYCNLTENYFDNPNWSYPSTDELENSNYGFLEAIALTVKKLRQAYPKAEIMFATMKMAYRTSGHANQFPPNNTKNTIVQYSEAIRKAADFFGCELIELDKCGITFENGLSNYFYDTSSSTPSHANEAGHELMAKRCIKDLQKIVLV